MPSSHHQHSRERKKKKKEFSFAYPATSTHHDQASLSPIPSLPSTMLLSPSMSLSLRITSPDLRLPSRLPPQNR